MTPSALVGGLVVAQLVIAVAYGAVGDWPRVAYWGCAAGISAATLRME